MLRNPNSEKRLTILLVLTGKEYINNFLVTSAIQDLPLIHDVTILVPNKLVHLVPEKFLPLTDSIADDIFFHTTKSFMYYSDLLRWKNRSKSKSFKFRERRSANWLNSLKSTRTNLINLKQESQSTGGGKLH